MLTQALEESKYDALVDPNLQKDYNYNEMARMVACAAVCVRYLARLRPRMSQVIVLKSSFDTLRLILLTSSLHWVSLTQII